MEHIVEVTHSNSIAYVLDSSACNIVNGSLEVVNTSKSLLITEEGQHHTNSVFKVLAHRIIIVECKCSMK